MYLVTTGVFNELDEIKASLLLNDQAPWYVFIIWYYYSGFYSYVGFWHKIYCYFLWYFG